MSHQCPKTRSDALDEATQTRHAVRSDHYLCDTVEQLFTHLSSLGVKWSQVQILSARPGQRVFLRSAGDHFGTNTPTRTPTRNPYPTPFTAPPSVAGRWSR